MTIDLNLAESCNRLLESIKKELGSNCIVNLNIDVQLPARLSGNWDCFNKTISQITEFIGQRFKPGAINIDLIQVGNNKDTRTISTVIKGVSCTKT